MVDVALYGILVAVAIAVMELAYRENVRIRKRNEDIIDNLYPTLISDIKESMHNYHVHYKIRNTSFTNFHILRNLRKSQEIEKIRVISKKTYEYLVTVENEIIPRLFKMDERKRVIFDKIKEEWVEYVTNPSIPHINYNHTNVMNRLYVATHLHFFNEELTIIETKLSEVIQGLIEEYPSSNIQYFPEETSDVFIQIVKDNMTELKQLDEDIRRLFKEIIEDKLFSQMAKDSRNTL